MPTTRVLSFKEPNFDHFNLSHFSKKILLQRLLCIFIFFFKFPSSNVSESLILNKATLEQLLLQLCTSSRMCSLYTFFFSFVHAPECAYCTSILYICHVIQFYLYFMLAIVKRNCIMFITVTVFSLKKKKKKKKRPKLWLG